MTKIPENKERGVLKRKKVDCPMIVDQELLTPEIMAIPEFARAVLIYRGMGWNNLQIAEKLRVDQSEVLEVTGHLDGLARVPKRLRKAMSIARWSKIEREAFGEITNEKLKESSASELIGIASKAAALIEKLDVGDKGGNKTVSSLRLQIQAYMDDKAKDIDVPSVDVE